MKRTFLIGVAAGALLAGANIASAQTMERGGAGGGAEQRGGAAAEQRGGGAGGGMEQRGQAQEQMKGTTGQAQQGQRAQDQQGGQQGQRAQDQKGGQQDQRAQDQKGGQQDQRAQDRQDQQGQRAQDRQDQQGQRAQDRQDQQGQRAQDAQRGGGDAKAKLSTEQRTKIRETVIRSSNAPRVTNVNFSISVGTTVPRTVRFAPLPPILVEVYPDWRSYEYFIVQEQIVIVEPGSLRIVAVLDV